MKSLWQNLMRRHVVQVGAIYLIVGWIVAQVTVVFAPALMLPDWFDTAVVFLVILGFPIALVLAWAFELTPDGIKKSSEVFGKEDSKGGSPAADQGSDHASIAVMPFANMSSDQDAEHLADGMTEDIITGLAHDPHLSVISRNAVFVYKNQPADLRQVGQDLGVRYILEGSIRNMGERIRVTAQLIETKNGSHIWANKYDRRLADIFDVQDEVIDEILSHVGSHLQSAEQKRYHSQPEDRLGKWGKFQRAMYLFSSAVGDFDKMMETRAALETAIEAEPETGYMHALMSFVEAAIFINAVVARPFEHLESAKTHLALAKEYSRNDPLSMTFCGATSLYIGEFDDAVALLERALSINPNDFIALAHLGLTLANLDRPEEAAECFSRAERLASGESWIEMTGWYKAQSLSQKGHLEQATALTEKFLKNAPRYSGGHFYMGMLLARQDRMQEAVKYIRKGNEICPETQLDAIIFLVRNHHDREEARRRDAAFREAWDLALGPQAIAK